MLSTTTMSEYSFAQAKQQDIKYMQALKLCLATTEHTPLKHRFRTIYSYLFSKKFAKAREVVKLESRNIFCPVDKKLFSCWTNKLLNHI